MGMLMVEVLLVANPSTSLNKLAILSKSSSLMLIEFVGVIECNPPSWKLTVLLVDISAYMESICVLNPHLTYLTRYP